MSKFILSIILCFFHLIALSQNKLEADIKKLTQTRQAEVGVAVLYQDDVFTISNQDQYPLMSVFKLHIALTALNKMEKDHITLDSMVYIKRNRCIKIHTVL